jgi:hypothetical protein
MFFLPCRGPATIPSPGEIRWRLMKEMGDVSERDPTDRLARRAGDPQVTSAPLQQG